MVLPRGVVHLTFAFAGLYLLDPTEKDDVRFTDPILEP
jgi:hypothetical protein